MRKGLKGELKFVLFHLPSFILFAAIYLLLFFIKIRVLFMLVVSVFVRICTIIIGFRYLFEYNSRIDIRAFSTEKLFMRIYHTIRC